VGGKVTAVPLANAAEQVAPQASQQEH